MKVLTATRETQGRRGNDFSFVPEGELVIFASECDGEGVDGRCGCKRAMSGLLSLTATTTFKVVDDPAVTQEGFSEMLAGHFIKDWSMTADEATAQALDDVKELLRLAGRFEVGDVLEKRGNTVPQRKPS